MLSPGKHKHLIVTQEQMQQVRDHYNVTRKSIEEDVNTIVAWYNAQPHLPQIKIDPEWVERLFIINKCSTERVKERLEMLFTLRRTMPVYFKNRNPVALFNANRKSIVEAILPKLAPDNSRILCHYVTEEAENLAFLECVLLILMISEYTQHHDYCIGRMFICDLRNARLRYLLKVNVGVSKNIDHIYRKVHGDRVTGLHFICDSIIMRFFVGFLRLFLPSKLMDRVKVHQNIESLHKFIPREVLPKDYGGYEKSLRELRDDWERILCSESYQEWLKEQEGITTDESKRLKH